MFNTIDNRETNGTRSQYRYLRGGTFFEVMLLFPRRDSIGILILNKTHSSTKKEKKSKMVRFYILTINNIYIQHFTTTIPLLTSESTCVFGTTQLSVIRIFMKFDTSEDYLKSWNIYWLCFILGFNP